MAGRRTPAVRPYPPDNDGRSFIPAPELEVWARATFIDPSGKLFNEEHEHLELAKIGFLWAYVPGRKGGRDIAGLCEKMPPMAMGKWQKARAEQQIGEWFTEALGDFPDFVITIDVEAANRYDDASFCALVEHELYHAGDDGFTDEGEQKFTLRGHDVEEFIGVIRRYGAGATELAGIDTKAVPTFGPAKIRAACGTCLRVVK